MVGKVYDGTGDGLAAGQVFGLEVRAIGGEDELRLGLGRRRAGLEGGQRLRHPPCVAGQEWMLLVWRTPPRSDLFDAPARRRLMVVALLPNASRKV